MKALSAALLILLAAGPAAAETAVKPPAGQYYMDKTHSSVVFKVNHLGRLQLYGPIHTPGWEAEVRS